MQVGDRVRIRPSGTSVFVIVDAQDDEGRFVIEAADEAAPGRYRFSMKAEDLIPEV